MNNGRKLISSHNAGIIKKDKAKINFSSAMVSNVSKISDLSFL